MRTRASKLADDSPHKTMMDRGLALTVLTGLGLLLVVGVVFSVAYGSERITGAAVEQQQAAESLRSATVVRAQVAIAVLLGSIEEDSNPQMITTEAREVAVREAGIALVELGNGVDALGAGGRVDDSEIPAYTDELVAVASDTLAHLGNREFTAARIMSNEQLDAAYSRLAAAFIALRDDLSAEINTADTLLGRIGNLARFLVAFFIPAAVIIVYREMVIRRHKQLELEHRLEAERQMARAREEFVANASHELRTPLTGITGMAMILEEDLTTSGSDLSRELVDVIIREASDLERIVEDLLTSARLDAGALHFSFDDVNVAVEVEEVAAGVMRSGADIDTSCRPALVRADRTRLRQIVRNLLSNAMKYGGPNIRVEGTAAGRSYVLVVADDGDGLPEPVHRHLFERFVHREGDTARTDSVGLGLAIVHALVVGMGGAISYEHDGRESRFTIRLPLASRPAGGGEWIPTPAGESAAPRAGDG